MQCSDCQRRGSSVANVASVSSMASASVAETASSLPSTPSPITVSPGSPTPPASPTWKPPSDASDAPVLWPPPPPSGCNGAGTSTTSTTWSSRQLCIDNIDLSLPLTSTLLKHAKLSGLSHRRLLGLDQPVSSPPLSLSLSSFSISTLFLSLCFFFYQFTNPLRPPNPPPTPFHLILIHFNCVNPRSLRYCDGRRRFFESSPILLWNIPVTAFLKLLRDP